MTPEVAVRRLRGPEWRAFRELRLDALRSDPLAFGSSLARESAYTPEKWKDWCRDGATGGSSVTFVAVGPSRELVGIVGTFFVEGSPHVWGMWTRPEWRNRGIGRLLMERLLAWLDKNRPGRPVNLDVNPTQAAAVRIYTKLGFRFNGVEEPLGHHPPAIIRQMVRVRRPRTRRGASTYMNSV
jgi:ribosomal protein S18 acetylase RimI-like enzyme